MPATGCVVVCRAYVRDGDALEAELDERVAEVGRLDIVAANAGILSSGSTEELTEEQWGDMIGVNPVPDRIERVSRAAAMAVDLLHTGDAHP